MSKCVRGNTNLCMGCRTCLIACVEAHSNEPIFEIKPENINFNPKLHILKSYEITVPFQCRHCSTPDCMKVCTKGAIYKEDGVVLIDGDKCDGCGDCVAGCPFGAIDMVQKDILSPDLLIANKCDLCRGVEGGPSCVRVCPTQALSIVDSEDIDDTAAERRMAQVYKNSLFHKMNKNDTEDY